MDLYTNSITILLVGSILILPLILFRGVSKYSIPFFYCVLIAATFYRPTLLGVDNENYINYLTDTSYWVDEKFKYSLIYLLTYLIPGSWQKLLAINLFSSSIIVFSLKRIFNKLKKIKTSNFNYLIYMTYLLCIATPLLLVHLRQYLAFSLIIFLISLYRNYNRNSLIYDALISIAIFLAHPVYTIFICTYFISKYFRNSLLNLFKFTTFNTKLVILILISLTISYLFLNIDYFYISITSVLPGFGDYGLREIVLNTTNTKLLISASYPFLLILPVILVKFFGKSFSKNNLKNKFYTVLFIYIIFNLPIIFLEYKVPFLYAIQRVKSGLYPAVFLLLFEVENINLKKPSIIIVSSASVFVTLFSIYRFSESVS